MNMHIYITTGNKFLMNIRMMQAIVHVVRCFIDDEIFVHIYVYIYEYSYM
jgi:hypothetical protein